MGYSEHASNLQQAKYAGERIQSQLFVNSELRELGKPPLHATESLMSSLRETKDKIDFKKEKEGLLDGQNVLGV